MSEKQVPRASLLGLDFVLHPAEFTKKATAKYGHVWQVTVAGLGPRVYGVSGAEGLQAFYDPENIDRYPAADRGLLVNAWTSRGFPGVSSLDGKNHLVRKNNFLTQTTWDSAEKFLQATDQPLVRALQTVGGDGRPFSYWDFINRLVLGLYSRQWFGMGIKDWEQGAHTADLIMCRQALRAPASGEGQDLAHPVL